MPTAILQPDWLCYSVGIGGDVSFDRALVERFGLRVRAFDPVAEFVDLANERLSDQPRFAAHRAAVAVADGPIRMQETHDPQSASVSSAGLYDSDQFYEVDGYTIASLMRAHGDATVDVLKLDIEGGEYDVLPALDLRGMGVKVFSVQFHHNRPPSAVKALTADFRMLGYEPVAVRPAVKQTYALSVLL